MYLTLSNVKRGAKGRKRRGKKTRCSSQEGKGTKGVINQNGWIIQGRASGEGQPNPWPGKFEREGGVCQSYPVTDRNLGMPGEPGRQVCFDMLNR